jgi:hypothetical protein
MLLLLLMLLLHVLLLGMLLWLLWRIHVVIPRRKLLARRRRRRSSGWPLVRGGVVARSGRRWRRMMIAGEREHSSSLRWSRRWRRVVMSIARMMMIGVCRMVRIRRDRGLMMLMLMLMLLLLGRIPTTLAAGMMLRRLMAVVGTTRRLPRRCLFRG